MRSLKYLRCTSTWVSEISIFTSFRINICWLRQNAQFSSVLDEHIHTYYTHKTCKCGIGCRAVAFNYGTRAKRRQLTAKRTRSIINGEISQASRFGHQHISALSKGEWPTWHHKAKSRNGIITYIYTQRPYLVRSLTNSFPHTGIHSSRNTSVALPPASELTIKSFSEAVFQPYIAL